MTANKKISDIPVTQSAFGNLITVIERVSYTNFFSATYYLLPLYDTGFEELESVGVFEDVHSTHNHQVSCNILGEAVDTAQGKRSNLF